MQRRQFITSLAASGVAAGLGVDRLLAADKQESGHPTYKTIADAMKSPREKLAFLPAITVRTKSKHPDYMATVDVDPTSKTYSQVVGRLSMPTPGDELHHFGWNACSSCYGERPRTHLVIPGLASSNIYIVNSSDPKNLKLEKTISGEEIAKKTNLSTPHTVHCRADGVIMISMLGDAKGEAPGGFLHINEDFEIVGPQLEYPLVVFAPSKSYMAGDFQPSLQAHKIPGAQIPLEPQGLITMPVALDVVLRAKG